MEYPHCYFSGCNDHKIGLDAGWIAQRFKTIEIDFMKRAGGKFEEEVPAGPYYSNLLQLNLIFIFTLKRSLDKMQGIMKKTV